MWAANADGTKPHLLASGIDALYQLAWLPSGDFLYDVSYHLFRVGHDGQPRPIATGVTFSLDTKGDKVAYQTAESCPTCHGPVEVLSLATGKTWKIAPTGQNLFPALSPDGRSVAFTRFLGSGAGRYVKPGGIWIAAAAGGTPVQRTKAGLCPQWSPDGRRLTYADSAGLHLIARNGGAGTLLLRENGLPACSTQWSPDGRRIASVTSHGRLVVIDPATRASRTIGPKHSVDLAWAPDGSRLLVSGGAGAQSCSSLWSMRPDGSGLRKPRAAAEALEEQRGRGWTSLGGLKSDTGVPGPPGRRGDWWNDSGGVGRWGGAGRRNAPCSARWSLGGGWTRARRRITRSSRTSITSATTSRHSRKPRGSHGRWSSSSFALWSSSSRRSLGPRRRSSVTCRWSLRGDESGRASQQRASCSEPARHDPACARRGARCGGPERVATVDSSVTANSGHRGERANPAGWPPPGSASMVSGGFPGRRSTRLSKSERKFRQRPQGYGQRPQVAVEGPESGARKEAAPRMNAAKRPARPLAPPPRGHFVTAQYEADCARFLAETKKLARRRAEATLGRPSAGLLGVPRHRERDHRCTSTLPPKPSCTATTSRGGPCSTPSAGRRDLRVSVTDRCNFRCVYCMPKEVFGRDYAFLERRELLTLRGDRAPRARLRRGSASRRCGITGGEPLVRRDLERLVAMLAEIDGLDLTLTTNGSLLPQKAEALRDAGLDRVTVSLDSLDDEMFRAMNDVDFPVARVLEGIDAAAAAGLPREGQHGRQARRQRDEHPADGRRFRGTGHILRFIEYMDVGHTNGWRLDEVVPAAEIVARSTPSCRSSRSSPTTPARSPTAGATATAAARSGSSPRSPAVLRRLHARAAVGRGTALHVPVRRARPRPARARSAAAPRTRSSRRRSRGIWGGRTDRYSELRTAETAARPKVEMSLHRRLSRPVPAGPR